MNTLFFPQNTYVCHNCFACDKYNRFPMILQAFPIAPSPLTYYDNIAKYTHRKNVNSMYVPFFLLAVIARVNCLTVARVTFSMSAISCSVQKRRKRLRLFRYPRIVRGVYFLTSISINVRLLDTAEFPAAYPGFKQDGQNRLVPHMEEIIAPA